MATTVMMIAVMAAWGALDDSAASAATRRLAHDRPTPTHHRPPVHTDSHTHGDPFCSSAFFGQHMGSLQKSTSAGPSGSTVLPGQAITVTLRWNPKDFGWRSPAIVEDCVSIGSHVSTHLSQDHRPGPSHGVDTFTYAMPSGGTDGQHVCDRGVVVSAPPPSWGSRHQQGGYGQGGGGYDQDGHDPYAGWQVETSQVLCYTILAAATPEASQVLLFPVIGLVIGGGGYLAVRHRRHRGVRHARHAVTGAR